MKTKITFEIYPSESKSEDVDWNWRAVSQNGNNMGSAGGYNTKGGAEKSLRSFIEYCADGRFVIKVIE